MCWKTTMFINHLNCNSFYQQIFETRYSICLHTPIFKRNISSMLKIHHYSLQGWQLLRPSSGETGGHDPVPETAQRSAGETSAGSHWRKQHAESQSLSPTQKTLSQSEGIFHTRGLCNVIVLGQCSSTNWANHAYSIYMYHCAKTLVLSYIAFQPISWNQAFIV